MIAYLLPRSAPASARPARATRAAVASLIALLALGSACGGEGNSSALPAVAVRDLRTGQQVELAGLAPARRPVALWLWGPGCSICDSEATAVDRFAAREGDRLTVVGLGSHGSPASAPRFVREHDMRTMRVLWDQESRAWDRLRVPAEPVTIVFDSSGREVDRWFGPFDEARALAAVTRAS